MSAVPMQWHMTFPPAWPRPLRTIALSPDVRGAVGISVDGLGLWTRRGWSRIDLPRFVAPASIEAVAWFGNHILVAGASSTVHLRGPDGTYFPFTFNVPGLVFHGVHTDAFGAVLVGEQLTHTGPIGAVATLTLRPGGILQLGCVSSPNAPPMRAVTRVDQEVLAAGDRGTLVALRDGELRTHKVCDTTFLAMVATGDGAAIAVGGGGFVFRVTPSLEAQLEAVQTTRALTAVTRGLDGTLYCGGEGRRVLRRFATGWARAGATVGAGIPDATVRALSAGSGGVTAFCDDGSVLEGSVAGVGAGAGVGVGAGAAAGNAGGLGGPARP
jgi:hypothetical protein